MGRGLPDVRRLGHWRKKDVAGEVAGFLNPMGEGISAGMESGYCAANAVAEYFHYPETVREAYRVRTENMKAYMQRQWSLVGGMTGTFREME